MNSVQNNVYKFKENNKINFKYPVILENTLNFW